MRDGGRGGGVFGWVNGQEDRGRGEGHIVNTVAKHK